MTFDVAAEAYDRFMGHYSAQLSAPLADLAGVQAGMRALDVGCGPGALTVELVARLGADHVTGVDPSEPFVAAAQERHPGVDIRRANAESLPFDDDTFDVAIAQLVVHFMDDAVAGLREMARVTRAGGVVAACVWDYGGDRAPISPFWIAARRLQPNVADESDLAGARAGHLRELLEAAGIGDVEEADLVAYGEFATFEDWWRPYLGGVGPAGALVKSLDEAGRDALREECRRTLPDPPFRLETHALAARGKA
jgi:SAM-dependent methyltransferase